MTSQEGQTTARINVKENKFNRGGLAKLPWVGRSFDDVSDTRAYVPDRDYVGYDWGVRPGDQLNALVEFQTDKFVYLVPEAAGVTVAESFKSDGPYKIEKGHEQEVVNENFADKVESKPSDGYGEYVSPVTEIVGDVPDIVTLFVGELKLANQAIDRSAAYFRKAATKICLKHRIAKMKLESRMDGWKANIRVVREMGGNETMIKDLEDYSSADGRELKALEDRMLGEIHYMAWTFISRENVSEDLKRVLNAERMFDPDKFDTRTATSYPFVLWMYSHGHFTDNSENAWKFLRVLEEGVVNDALGQKSLIGE